MEHSVQARQNKQPFCLLFSTKWVVSSKSWPLSFIANLTHAGRNCHLLGIVFRVFWEAGQCVWNWLLIYCCGCFYTNQETWFPLRCCGSCVFNCSWTTVKLYLWPKEIRYIRLWILISSFWGLFFNGIFDNKENNNIHFQPHPLKHAQEVLQRIYLNSWNLSGCELPVREEIRVDSRMSDAFNETKNVFLIVENLT